MEPRPASVVTDIRRLSASLLGAGFLAVASAYALVRGGPQEVVVLEAAVPAAVGLGLIAYGYWFARSAGNPRRVDGVTASTLLGTTFFGVVAVWMHQLHMVRAGAGGDVLQVVLLGGSVGAVVGTLMGHLYVELGERHRTTAQLSRALASSMDGVAIVEGDQHVYANEAYADLYGYPDVDAIETESWSSLFTPEAVATVESEVIPRLRERGYWRGRLDGVATDGTTFPTEVTATAGGEGEEVVLVVRDVTVDREREQRIQVLNRVLRHNLRNTFTVIRGHANLLAERAPELEADHVEPIREEIDELLSTADKARGVERTMDRRGERGFVDPSEAVRACVDRATAAYPQANVRSRVEESGLPDVDACLVDAFDELVDNAVAHAERENPTVVVSVRAAEDASAVESGTGVEFSVVDDGPGIPEAERRALLEGRETPLEHGSGLGLWLVNWLVANAGGELHFSSAPNRGTAVTITVWDDRTAVEAPRTASPVTEPVDSPTAN